MAIMLNASVEHPGGVPESIDRARRGGWAWARPRDFGQKEGHWCNRCNKCQKAEVDPQKDALLGGRVARV